MNKTTLLFFLLFTIFSDGYCQQKKMNDSLVKVPTIIFCGLDFSCAQIISESAKHKKELQEGLFREMSNKFLAEQTEQLKRGLSAVIIPDNMAIQSLNTKTITDVSASLYDHDLPRILKEYQMSQNTGTGLVILVVSLDKHQSMVELYPVIFDISTRTVIWAKKVSAKSRGGMPGLFNSWYPKIVRATGEFIDTYKLEKAEKEGKAKHSNIFLKFQPNELDLGFKTQAGPDVNISVEGGYRLNFLDSWKNNGSPIPTEYLYGFLAFSGFSFRLAAECKISRRSCITPVIGFQQLYCNKVIYNPGGYAGTDDEVYRVWSQRNNEFVFQLCHYINLGRAPYPAQFFYGIGVKMCSLSEHYSIDGYPYHKTPSNKVVNENVFQPCATFGVIIKLASF